MSIATLWPTFRTPNARPFVTAAISMSPGALAALPTVTTIESAAVPACATMTAEPAATPVTTPLALTVATDGLRLVQVGAVPRVLPNESLIVSEGCTVCVGAVVRIDGGHGGQRRERAVPRMLPNESLIVSESCTVCV